MKKHKIGWLNVPGYIPQTWNPIVGCSKISAGCRNCYAERMAYRLWCMDTPGYCHTIDRTGSFGWNGKTSLLRLVLEKPLHWKKPRAIFVNSMGDLFHENTPDEWIDRVFAVMALCPQHLFIVLTKRAERMDKYFFQALERSPRDFPVFGKEIKLSGDGAVPSAQQCWKTTFHPAMFPLPNVWLGVTAENQAAADERIPHLLRCPATRRFVSCEPLIGPVNPVLSYPYEYMVCTACGWHGINPDDVPRVCVDCDKSDENPDNGNCLHCDTGTMVDPCPRCGCHSWDWSGNDYGSVSSFRSGHEKLPGIDWIICGGESGPGARAMNPEWARSLRDQAQSAGVPFFFKQWGRFHGGYRELPVTHSDVLDGRQWHEFPTIGKSEG